MNLRLLLFVCVSAFAAASHAAPLDLTQNLPCSSFKWSAVEGISNKAAILVPISLNGKSFWYQLDTGAEGTIPYGTVNFPGWVSDGKAVRIPKVSLGGSEFSAIRAYPRADMQPDSEVQGTVGLDLLVGHTVVLDFPHQRFCLLESGNTPKALYNTSNWANAAIRHGRLFVDMELNGRNLDRVAYDTGSSPFVLQVDLDDWKAFTGKTAWQQAATHLHIPSWGKDAEVAGAPATGDLIIGKSTFPHPLITTRSAQAHFFRDGVQVQGVLGNAQFLNKVIVLNLGSYPSLSILESNDMPSTH
jgi:hypothetical protein